ncbi:37744_t:CDS:2, partial [Gigaspora margarita]
TNEEIESFWETIHIIDDSITHENHTMEYIKKKLNKDKQSKDWIIFKDQRSGSWKLERIEKKKERKLLVEHWLERKENNGKYLAVRCMHCALNKKGKENNCITKIKVENVKECILNMIKNKENWFLPCALDLLLRKQDALMLTKLKLIDSIEELKGLKAKVSDGTEKENKSRSTRQDKRLKENRNE